MDGDGAGGVERHVVPHPAVDLTRGEHGACVLHEKAQNVVLLGGQCGVFTVHGDGLGIVVQPDAADDQRAGLHRTAAQLQIPPQLGAHPRQQLHRVEGLGDIVVRAYVQPQHLVGVLALGSQQDHRHIAGLPQLSHGGETVHHRHHDIHENEMHVLPCGDGQGILAIIRLQNAVALRRQVDLQCRNDIPLIIADQNGIHMPRPPFHTPNIIREKGARHNRGSISFSLSLRSASAAGRVRRGGWASTPPS